MQFALNDLSCNYYSNTEINKRLTGARNDLAHEYSNGYICDAINELADSDTPIYYAEIFRAAHEVDEYITDGICEGIISINPDDFSLSKLIQQGYYLMIERDLYDNLSDIIFNHCARILNEEPIIAAIPEDSTQAEELSEWLDDYTATLDSDDRFESIDEALNDKIDEISDIEE